MKRPLLYVLQVEDTPFVKVGYTLNLFERFKAHTRDFKPYELKLIKTYNVINQENEVRIHNLLKGGFLAIDNYEVYQVLNIETFLGVLDDLVNYVCLGDTPIIRNLRRYDKPQYYDFISRVCAIPALPPLSL